MFQLLLEWVKEELPPLVRLDAADALGKSHLDTAQLKALTAAVSAGGVLEVPRLITAFEQASDEEVGQLLITALTQSAGGKSVGSEVLTATLASYPQSVRDAAEPLLAARRQDAEKQKARLDTLTELLAGGEIQRGRELFFGNKKAICATCHTVQGQGGQIGPDLSKIGAIRASRDLLEAVVFPSASFARGYEPFNIVTHDGQVTSGIIARETADAIHVVNTARVETRIARSEIESLQQSTVSIMPEGMDNQLTQQEFADLLAFLRSLR
jgi:putative heme-binding domain-containing protein